MPASSTQATSQDSYHLKSFKTTSSFYSTIPDSLKMDSLRNENTQEFTRFLEKNMQKYTFLNSDTSADSENNYGATEENQKGSDIDTSKGSFDSDGSLKKSNPQFSTPPPIGGSFLEHTCLPEPLKQNDRILRSPSSIKSLDVEEPFIQLGYSFNKSQKFPIIYGDEHDSNNVDPLNDKYCPTSLKNDDWRSVIINNYIDKHGSCISFEKFSNEIKQSLKPKKIIVEKSSFLAPRVYLEGIYNRVSLRDYNQKNSNVQNSKDNKIIAKEPHNDDENVSIGISRTSSDNESDISDIEDMNFKLQKYKSSKTLMKLPMENVSASPNNLTSVGCSSLKSPLNNSSKWSYNEKEKCNPHCFSFWQDAQEDDTLPLKSFENFDLKTRLLLKKSDESVQIPKNLHFSGFTESFTPAMRSRSLLEVVIPVNNSDQNSQTESISKSPITIPESCHTFLNTPDSIMYTPERLIQNITPPSSYTEISLSHRLRINSDLNCAVHMFKDKSKYFSLYDKLLFELINTEISYRDDLTIVRDVYIKNLNYEHFKYILSQEEKQTLFGNINCLIDLSNYFIDLILLDLKSSYVPSNSHEVSAINGDRSFLSLLGKESNIKALSVESPVSSELINIDHEVVDSMTLKKLISGNDANIGDTLINIFSSEKFKRVFKEYVNCSKQQEKILKEKLNHSKEFNKWHDTCINVCKAETITTSWNLESLLIKPVQRLLKYKLLVKLLLERCENVHHCFSLQEALNIISNITNDINKTKSLKGSIIKRFESGSIVNFSRKNELSSVSKSLKRESNVTNKSLNESICTTPAFNSVLSPATLNFCNDDSTESVNNSTSLTPNNLQSPPQIKNLKSFQIRQSQFSNIPNNRIRYVDLTLEFKRKYTFLKVLHDDVLQTMKSLSEFRRKNYKVNWSFNIILVESENVSDLHNMNEKCSSVIKNTCNSLNNQLLVPMQKCQKICDEARKVINEEREYRIKYYEKTNNLNKKDSIKRAVGECPETSRSNLLLIKNLNGKTSKDEVSLEDRMAKTENFLMEKLPEMNLMLEKLIENVGYNYLRIMNEKFNKDFINSLKNA